MRDNAERDVREGNVRARRNHGPGSKGSHNEAYDRRMRLVVTSLSL
jgi:hypothetical protein